MYNDILTIFFSVQLFHQYLYGREFILWIEHKPLLSIVSKKKGIPVTTASIAALSNTIISLLITNRVC